MNLVRPLILASNSPRRQYLMRELGYQFTVRQPDSNEDFPRSMPPQEVPLYLARKKAASVAFEGHEIVLTSDTVVILNREILNKPADRDDAIRMLSKLSGNTHIVITAFCLKDQAKEECYHDTTFVTFNHLNKKEISDYVDRFKPYDKAGAYGAQDCLPSGVNPCSQEELDFLKKIGKMDLTEKTFTHDEIGKGVNAIQKIDGSYFNVMGLPIHKVYESLNAFPS